MVDFWIFGLPVIASRLRAVSETYDETVIEYYEPGDARDLARAIKRLHDDPGRREELARNGSLAEKRHGWSVQQGKLLAVYGALLAERSPGQLALPDARPEPR
jgi:glycosyltransferase involved in cell wall biosynthesis